MANQLKHIQAHFKSERRRLTEELKLNVIPNAAERHEGSYGKREEAATEYSDLERQSASLQRIRKRLAEVEHTLGKLEKGTYGLCDFCGKPIPSNRLEAVPQTNLCLDCKALHKNDKDRSPGLGVAQPKD